MKQASRPQLSPFERKLQGEALLARRAADDYLVLADATLIAAIDGSRALHAAERAALSASPLTLRRFKVLAQERRAAWQGSAGMLRAADSGAALLTLATDDGHWTLHFIEQDGGWQVVLKVDAGAPFAARLLADGAVLTVRDGAGAVILQGSLDSDGECEQAWPMAEVPAAHFQQHGAVFTVAPGAAAR